MFVCGTVGMMNRDIARSPAVRVSVEHSSFCVGETSIGPLLPVFEVLPADSAAAPWESVQDVTSSIAADVAALHADLGARGDAAVWARSDRTRLLRLRTLAALCAILGVPTGRVSSSAAQHAGASRDLADIAQVTRFVADLDPPSGEVAAALSEMHPDMADRIAGLVRANTSHPLNGHSEVDAYRHRGFCGVGGVAQVPDAPHEGPLTLVLALAACGAWFVRRPRLRVAAVAFALGAGAHLLSVLQASVSLHVVSDALTFVGVCAAVLCVGAALATATAVRAGEMWGSASLAGTLRSVRSQLSEVPLSIALLASLAAGTALWLGLRGRSGPLRRPIVAYAVSVAAVAHGVKLALLVTGSELWYAEPFTTLSMLAAAVLVVALGWGLITAGTTHRPVSTLPT